MIDLTADSPVKKSVVAKNKNVVIPKVVSAPPNQVVEAAPMEPEVPSPRTASPAHVEEKTPHFPGSPMEHTAVEESPPPPRSRVTQYIPVDFLPEKDAASRKAPSGKVRNRVTFAPEVRESPATPVGLTKGFLGTRVGAGGLGLFLLLFEHETFLKHFAKQLGRRSPYSGGQWRKRQRTEVTLSASRENQGWTLLWRYHYFQA